MPSVIAILRTSHLEIEAGNEVETVLTVNNTGSIVEQFNISVLGDAATWASIEPPALSLFPNTQQDVTVTFRAPREWHISPGVVSFGLKVEPANDAQGSVVEEGELELAPYQDLNAELIPAVATAKMKGKYGIAIDSTSNVPVPVTLRGRDPSDTLVINFKPRTALLQPGTTNFAKMTVEPRKRYLRGPEKQARFKVAIEPEDGEPLLLDATLIQRGMLPKGSYAALAILAILGGWFFVIRPTVKNAAVSAVQPAIQNSQKSDANVTAQLAKTNAAVAGVKKKVTQVSTATKSGNSSVTNNNSTNNNGAGTTTTTTAAPTTTTSPSGSGSSSNSSTTTTAAPSTTTSATTTTTTTTTIAPTGPALAVGNFSQTLPVLAQPNAVQQQSFTVPSSNTFDLTDIIMQNQTAVQGSSLQVGLETPHSSSPEWIFLMSLATTTPEDFSLKTPIVFGPGDTLVASVSCAGGGTQPCSTSVLFDGTVQAG